MRYTILEAASTLAFKKRYFQVELPVEIVKFSRSLSDPLAYKLYREKSKNHPPS